MEPSLVELTQNLQKTIDSLETSLKVSDSKRQDARRIADFFAESTKAASEGALIELGDGIWAQKTQQEAKDFYERKIKRLLNEYNCIEVKIQEARRTLEGIRNFDIIFQTKEKEAEISCEELPIVDIQENLDEDGNVINVKINDKTFSAISDSDDKLRSQRDITNRKDEDSNSEQIRELLEDMELSEREKDLTNQLEAIRLVNDSQDFSINCGADGEVTSTKLEQTIDPRNVLELELIANDIDSEDDPREDAIKLDYSYQDTNGDFSDSDSDFDKKYSLLPSSSTHHDRLWKEVQELRNKMAQTDQQRTGKKVRFKETLEINEVENVGKILRNLEHEKQSVSRFKENLILNCRSGLKPSDNFSSGTDDSQTDHSAGHRDEEVTTDIKEKSLRAEFGVSSFNSDPIERSNEVASDKKTKRSRFKIARATEANDTASTKMHQSGFIDNNENFEKFEAESFNSLLEDLSPNDTDEFNKLEEEVARDRNKKVTSKFKKMIHQNPKQNPQGKHLLPTLLEDSIQFVGMSDSKSLQETINEQEWSQEDTQELMSAYNSGLFDDDMEVNGPVVNELGDFEKLNSIIESMPTSKSKWEERTTEREKEDLDQMISSDSLHSNSDDEAVMNEIIENEYDPLRYGTEEGFTIEQDITQREVENNYYRLRQKIYAEFGNEVEAENNYE